MTNNIAKIRAALEAAKTTARICVLPGLTQETEEAIAALAELERAAAEPEPVSWMWNDELGIPHVSAGQKKPVWVENGLSSHMAKIVNLRPLYAVPPVPVAEIREPTPEECERIHAFWLSAVGCIGRTPGERMGGLMFNAVRAVMWPKSEGL